MVFNIQRYCIDDGDGIRTCVFFKGFPLHCKWRHNIESISFSLREEFDERLCIHCGKYKEGCPTGARAIIGREMTTEQIMKIVLRDKPFYGKNGGLTVTGGEPMAQFASVYQQAQRAKIEGISFMMETCGFAKYTITGPAIVNILALTPKTKPSACVNLRPIKYLYFL